MNFIAKDDESQCTSHLEDVLDFIYKKSFELTKDDKDRFNELFASCFEGRRLPQSIFDKKYLNTFCGYSYHGLLYEDGLLYGAYNAIPTLFDFFGKNVIFAFAVDAMIDPTKRNIFYVKNIAEITTEGMKADGVDFVWGAGKSEMTSVNCRMLNWKYFGKAQTYIAINRYLNFSIKTLKLLMNVHGINKSTDISSSFVEDITTGKRSCDAIEHGEYNIKKINDNVFKSHRYGYFPIEYKTITLPKGGEVIYTTTPYYSLGDKIPFTAAYILDVYPLNQNNLELSINAIRSAEKVDISIYIGWLDFKPRNMYHFSGALDIRPSFFSGKILSQRIDERVFNVANWNLNLACSDVI